MTARADGAAGFTLIEMVIATTLFGFLSAMMVGGLHLGTRVMQSGAKRIESSAHLNTGYEFLRREIAQAQPLAFDGVSDRLSFITLASAYRATGGYQQITLGQDGAKLVAAWRPYVRDAGAGDSARKSVLLDDARAEFTYFGVADGERAPRWHREWRGRTLPSLVGIAVFRGDGRMAPGLMIAPRLSGEPGNE